MSVIEKFAAISETIEKLMTFIMENEESKASFKAAYEFDAKDDVDAGVVLFNFMLEGCVGEEKIPYTQFYLSANPETSAEEKGIITSIGAAMTSFFEIKRILKNGFDLKNIINEQEYFVLPLVKMTHFRGMYAGQYILASVIKYQNEYFLIEIKDEIPASEKKDVYREAVAAMINAPGMYYQDAPETFKKLEALVGEMYNNFTECFAADEIITTNTQADALMMYFDAYCRKAVDDGVHAGVAANFESPETFGYFEIEELNNFYDNFLEKSLDGFSAHDKSYDVGIICDKEHGLFTIPFWGTLNKIFEENDYKSVEGASECVINFLQNKILPPAVIYRLAHKHHNFMTVVNDMLNAKYTLDDLIKKYKHNHLEQKIFSSTTILYQSNLFTETINMLPDNNEAEIGEKPEIHSDIGRNDLCPCGSGKKYKKCCMN